MELTNRVYTSALQDERRTDDPDRPGTGAASEAPTSVVEDHSRLAHAEALPDEKGTTCAAFLERAIDHFAHHGITRIERLLTDNAWAYRYSLRGVCAAHGIAQRLIQPRCPWKNGKVGRFNRTLQVEWVYWRVYRTNDARTAARDPVA